MLNAKSFYYSKYYYQIDNFKKIKSFNAKYKLFNPLNKNIYLNK